jgi:4-amino-4-deoxy-L-arabinose transferase-like glycosyltransferase
MTCKKNAILIFSVALSVRLILFFAVGSWNNENLNNKILVGDAPGYHTLASNLLEKNKFSKSDQWPYEPELIRPPLYPLFLSSVYFIFGYKPYIAILIQIIAGSIYCVVLYKIGKLFLKEKFALLAGLLISFEYSNIVLCNMLLADTLFSFIFIFHIYFLLIFFQKDNHKAFFGSGLYLGLSTLCKPVSVYFIVFLSAVFGMFSKHNIKYRLFHYVAFFMLFSFVISPWIIRNYIVAGEFLLSSQQKSVLRWNLPKTTEKAIDHLGNSLTMKSDNQKSKPANRSYLQSIASDARRYLNGTIRFFIETGSSYLTNLLNLPGYRISQDDWKGGWLEVLKKLFSNKSIFNWVIICIYGLFLLILYATMCVGIYSGIKNKFLPVALFITIIFYFLVASAPLPSHTNYRMPAMAYIILLSCYGLMYIHRRTTARKR